MYTGGRAWGMWVVGVARNDTYEEVVVVVLLDGTAVHIEEDQDGVDQVAQVRQLADWYEEIPRQERVDEA